MEQELCYMCNLPADSREHVPPKCIFPESKDLSGENYRKSLITVPSCYEHNSKKSKDDEFLMVSLAGIFGNNSIGFRHKFGKVDRAISRSSMRLIESAFLKKKHYVIKTKDNNFLEVIWGTPDHQRLINCFKHIAYGLHYEFFKKQFNGEVKVLLGYLHSKDQSNNNFVQFIKDRSAIDLEGKTKNGENPDIFYYQFTEPDQFGLYMLHLRFYGGIDIYISFIQNSVEMPGHLGFELINKGIPTTITLGDKEYQINHEN